MINILLEMVGTAECNDICADIFLNQQLVGNYTASLEPYAINLTVPDDCFSHTLKIVMSGKNTQHTIVSQDGNIITDASIVFSILEFEHINMMPIFCQGKTCYYHSHNDSARSVELDEFYGYMGCNGYVDIQFDTPIYQWFNEHF